MKRYILFFFLLFSMGAGAQVLTKNYTPYEWMQGQAFSFYLRLPLDTLAIAPNGSTAWKNGVLYGKWNGRFDAIGSGAGTTDTSFLSSRIDARVRYSDTLNMLSKYLRKSDTASMLSKYLRKADTLSLSNRIDAITSNYYKTYFVSGAQYKSLYGVDQGGITRLLASWQDLMSDTGSLAMLSGIDTAFNAGSTLSFVKNGNTWNIPYVSSFNSRTGAVIPQLSDYLPYYATTNHTHTFADLLSKPTTLAGYGITNAVTSNRTLTINGVTYDLTANRSWDIAATAYTDAQARAAISLTTTGTSGAATYNPSTGVLNIPNYTGVGGADDSAIVRIQNIGDTIHRYFRRNGEAAYDVKLDCSTCGGSGTGTGTTYTFNASSVKLTGSNITLQGDVNAPGANKVYGTNASGTKGWQGATLVDTTGQANGKILEFQNGEVVAGHTADSIQVSTTTPTHGNHYFNPSDTSYNVRYSGVWFKFKANGGATGGGGEEPQGMDVDALAYITAAESGGAVFSTAYETAISNFVTDLKTAGIYSTHFDAIWLGTGGSEAGVKLNLLNPQNTDAAYRLTFNNGATFAATGVTGNGSNQTISTHLIPGLAAKMGDNDSHVFVYQRSTTATDNPVWGINQAGSQIYLFPKESGGAGAWKYTNKTNHSFTPSDASGLWLASKGGNTFLHRNNILIVETQDSELGDILSNDYDIVFNGWNSNGTPGLAHAAELSLMSVGRFMNETQRLAFHNAVTTFLTTIGAL